MPDRQFTNVADLTIATQAGRIVELEGLLGRYLPYREILQAAFATMRELRLRIEALEAQNAGLRAEVRAARPRARRAA